MKNDKVSYNDVPLQLSWFLVSDMKDGLVRDNVLTNPYIKVHQQFCDATCQQLNQSFQVLFDLTLTSCIHFLSSRTVETSIVY